jgi:hypothetical protein
MKDFYQNVKHETLNVKVSFEEILEAYEQIKKDYNQILKEMYRYRTERNLAWEQARKQLAK